MKHVNAVICSINIALSIVVGCFIVPSVALADLRVDDRGERMKKRF